MGRSTSYLSNASHVTFFNVGHFGYTSDFDDDGNEIPGTEHFDEVDSQMQWDDMIENVTSSLMKKYPSLEKCDDWDDRETRIFLRNQHCEIGISEYGGLASISIRPVDNGDAQNAMAPAWIDSVWPRMQKIISENAGPCYAKQGSFSNGEGIYSRIDDSKTAPANFCHNGMGVTYAY